MQKNNVRLSKDVIPTRYDIHLKPDLENFTFSGYETIFLTLLKGTKTIILHSKETEIETVSISIGKEKIFAKNISYDTKKETATFTFPKNIPAGKVKLTLVFRGILNDKMRGFYRSKYVVEGVEHHMATTQFEATDARRAFPCFDEPAKKAVFNVSLTVPQNKTAISNTLPVSTTKHEAGYQVIKFAPTPKMSTYLLAFIVGDFEYIEGKTNNGVKVRIFTTPGKKHQAGFALKCAIKSLEFYEKYFDIKYPLNTLDMIAIPDFAAGAMENWGAVTYRETALLVDEEHTALSNKQYVALVIAHELAHQWFGNLVTMEWWTHLWLNEGFASYIEYLAVNELFPEWDIWTTFSNNDLGVALRLDSLKSTHSIEIPVHHPDEIGEIFDEVSYSKGASVIRMLASYIGEKNFRDGLRYYLKKHSYKNTETVHLWEAFEKVSKKPVGKMMDVWTSKPGYPVLDAKVEREKIVLSQSRFFASPISKQKANDRTIWPIPLVVGNNKKKEVLYLGKKNGNIPKSKDWQKLNLGESGFFRVAYNEELLNELRGAVEKKLISSSDRLGIARDLFALSESGDISTTQALSFLKAYKNEDNYMVWLEIAIGISRIEQIFYTSKLQKEFRSLILELFTPLYKKLDWEKKKDEKHSDTMLRSLVLSKLGRAGHQDVLKEAKIRFAKLDKNEHVDPDVRSAVYTTIATHGGLKEYETLVRKYKRETLHEERGRIGGALGDFSSDKILCLFAHFALSEDVRKQDSVSLLSSLAANPLGRSIWLKYIKTNWKTLVSRYGDGGHTLGRLVKAISNSAEKKHLKTFKEFFQKNEAPGAKRAVEQVIERMEGNVEWLKRDSRNLKDFFKIN